MPRFSSIRFRALLSVVLLAQFSAATARCDDQQTGQNATKRVVTRKIATNDDLSVDAIRKLVEQLGADSFIQRRQASERLIQLGLKATPVLKQALRDPDLEIRMQAQRILVHSVQQDFESRLAAFIADTRGRHDHGLPGWSGFQQLVGGSRSARRLFSEMIRAETPMLSAIDGKTDISDKFNKRVQDIRNRMYSNYQQREVATPTIATLLYVACDPKIKKSSMTASNMNSLLNYNNTMTAFKSGNDSAILRQLLTKWILRKDQNYSQKYYGVSLALNYDLGDTGIKLAREIMATPNVPSYIVQYAAIAIGKYGGKTDIPLLMPHVRDQTVCHTWSNPQIKKEPIRIQVRDVVMAMVMHLAKQNPKDYGYRLLIDNPSTIYTVYSFGFVNDSDRDKTIRQWNEYAKKNKIPHLVPVIATPKKATKKAGAAVKIRPAPPLILKGVPAGKTKPTVKPKPATERDKDGTGDSEAAKKAGATKKPAPKKRSAGVKQKTTRPIPRNK